MIASCRDAASSVLLEVPAPLNCAELQTQPSVARANLNSLLGSETEDAWSSSATRLFRFFSTGDANVDSAPLPIVQKRNQKRPEAIGVTFIKSESPRLARVSHPGCD